MTSTTTGTGATTTADTSAADIAAVRAGFEAFAAGDVATFIAGFHPDATWNHRNDDHLGGVHRGIDAIMAFLAESGRLTAAGSPTYWSTLRTRPSSTTNSTS